jgi:hypothetical protein
MQMLDGFNAGWIEFDQRGAGARKSTITIDQAIAALVSKKAANEHAKTGYRIRGAR